MTRFAVFVARRAAPTFALVPTEAQPSETSGLATGASSDDEILAAYADDVSRVRNDRVVH
jgi:hypothetical protein